MAVTRTVRTLPGRDYHAPEVFERERERVFHREWFYVGRAETVAGPGEYLSTDVVGEPILVVRDREGSLRAFYNVCRHRGSELCEVGSGRLRNAIKCPYHAWSYSLAGELIGTPNVAPDEVDRASLPLRRVAVDVWDGFLFVCLGEDPPSLRDWLAAQFQEPLAFERFRLGELRVAVRTRTAVAANWKILIENYQECLHCPSVHPELVQAVPAYRKGWVFEAGREDGGVSIADGASLTTGASAEIPPLPMLTEREASSVYGVGVFPNMMIDVEGNVVVATRLVPTSPRETVVEAEYLFHPETMAAAGFDPTAVVDFNELVAGQDNAVCERVQRGVASRSFDGGGVLAEKDAVLAAISEVYLASRGPLD